MSELAGAIESRIKSFKDTLNTSTPARVTRVNTNDNGELLSIDVIPQINKLYGDGLSLSRSTIYKVPVIFTASGGAYISTPVKVGDPVLLISCQQNIEDWMDDGEVANPPTLRKFSATDCVAIPGLYPFGVDRPTPSTENLEVYFADTKISIAPDGAIEITGASTLDITIGGDSKITSGGNTEISTSGELNIVGNSVKVSSNGQSLVGLLESIQTALATAIIDTSGTKVIMAGVDSTISTFKG